MLQALGWGISTVEQTAGRDCGTAGVRSDVALAENNLDIERILHAWSSKSLETAEKL